MICPTCGRENAEHIVFCLDCGARLKARVVPPTPPVGTAPPLVPQPGLVSGPPAPQPAGTPCPRCQAIVPPGVRFCTTCGHALGAASPGPAPAPLPTPAPVAPAFVPAPVAAPIAPAPVVDLAGPKAEVATKACPRCRGEGPASSQFCRFCGAPLGAAAPPEAAVSAPATAATSAQAQGSPPVAAPPRPASRPKLDVTLVSPPPAFDGVPAEPLVPAHEEPAAQPAAPPPPGVPAAGAWSAEATRKVAPPATAPQGRLIVIAKDGGQAASHAIADQLDIGRTEGEIVLQDDPYLSPRHARLYKKNGKLFVRDLGSVNGVFRRLRPDAAGEIELGDLDLILVGQQVLRFEIVKDGEEGFGPASQHGTMLFGTPATPRLARLSQRTTEGVTRNVFHVHKAETILGRESGDLVYPDDPFLSRRHARIRVTKEGKETRFFLADLASSNGTFIQIRGETPLEHGDELRMGQQLFRVDLSAATTNRRAEP